MNLQDFSPKITVADLEKQYKNQFSKPLEVGSLSLNESEELLSKTKNMISKFKLSSPKARYSEKNPTYLRLKMVEEAAALQIATLNESITQQLIGSYKMTPNYVKALRAVAQGAKLKESTIKKLKVSKGLQQVLESQDMAVTFMKKIVESKTASKKPLTEGEIATAQTTLAAQDIADQIQSMIEKFADIRYKEIPALNDSIRASQGVEEANQFTDTVLASLESLTGSLEGAKGEINNAVASLTGEGGDFGADIDITGPEGGEVDMDIDGGDEMDMEPEMGGDEDLGDEFDLDFEPDDEEAVDLGRERR